MNHRILVRRAVLGAVVLLLGRGSSAADGGTSPDSGARGAECGSKDDCFRKAKAYDEGKGVPRDIPRASGLYAEACEKGNGPACDRLATVLASGVFLPRDEKRALGLYEKGCGYDHAKSCDEVGNLLSAGSSQPGAFSRDHQRAATFFEKGCNLGEGGSCYSLAQLCRAGKGVKKDVRRAKALLKRAKELGFEIPD